MAKTHLHSKNAHTTRPLRQNHIPSLQLIPLQPIQRIPRRQPGTGQRGALQEVQALRHGHEAVLVEDAVLAQRAVEGAAQTRHDGLGRQGPRDVALVEERADLVALGEAGDFGADGVDDARAVGAGYQGGFHGEGVLALFF